MDENIDEVKRDSGTDPRATDRENVEDELSDDELENVSGGKGKPQMPPN